MTSSTRLFTCLAVAPLLCLAACAETGYTIDTTVVVPPEIQPLYSREAPALVIIGTRSESGRLLRSYSIGALCDPAASEVTFHENLEGAICPRRKIVEAWLTPAAAEDIPLLQCGDGATARLDISPVGHEPYASELAFVELDEPCESMSGRDSVELVLSQ